MTDFSVTPAERRLTLAALAALTACSAKDAGNTDSTKVAQTGAPAGTATSRGAFDPALRFVEIAEDRGALLRHREHLLQLVALEPEDERLRDVQLSPVAAVHADAVLLQRVLVNLLSNALAYSPDGVAPVIATSEFGQKVQLRVIDSGPGIPPERREGVFLPFQRHGDTDNTAGIGLGLALSRGFVEAMGGTLEAEETPGGGVTMVVELGAVQ